MIISKLHHNFQLYPLALVIGMVMLLIIGNVSSVIFSLGFYLATYPINFKTLSRGEFYT